MNFVSIVRSLFAPLSAFCATEDDRLRWRQDPLSHPSLDAMTVRELGDIPLRPVRLDRCAA